MPAKDYEKAECIEKVEHMVARYIPGHKLRSFKRLSLLSKYEIKAICDAMETMELKIIDKRGVKEGVKE